MENKIINLKLLAEVAKALKELRPKMVFVGGAVISLYADDPASDEIRPTADIDMTVQITGYSEWIKMEKRFVELGFTQDPQGHSMGSYKYKNTNVDVLPSENSPVGISNTWYKPGFESLKQVTIEDVAINILSVSYFLATKFEAFNSRGKDYRTSHDFEDIIYVMDNCTTIVEDIRSADEKVKSYLLSEFDKIRKSPYMDEIIRMHIHPLMVDERLPLLLTKINQIFI